MSITKYPNILPPLGQKGKRKVSIAHALKLQKSIIYKPFFYNTNIYSRIRHIPKVLRHWFNRMDNRGFLDGHK
jgi:hypothetical protein